jgi:hypothetical protein
MRVLHHAADFGTIPFTHTIRIAGACCISGHLHEGTPEGTSEFTGFKTYITTPPDGSKDEALVYISDIFGYALNVYHATASIELELETPSR